MMNRTCRLVASLCLTALLAAPLAVIAAPKPQAAVSVRIYDKDHKDYHNWDSHENEMWGQFLVENKRKNHEFAKASQKEQAEYWKWRHDHPDR